ncbi:hypothetical protein VTN00DRAFT_7554 [Thermoascus crustaceus]|uniref:uncharacterized protein n=1 Tax=Thermoascus crustaceus TaxID=5088 RepID=UPI00374344F6
MPTSVGSYTCIERHAQGWQCTSKSVSIILWDEYPDIIRTNLPPQNKKALDEDDNYKDDPSADPSNYPTKKAFIMMYISTTSTAGKGKG